MISYAQNHEDVLLARLFGRGVPGFYIDVGAHDPVANSLTKHFYDLGWKGINVEPASQPFERLEGARTRDVNLNIGLSDQPGTITLHEAPPDYGISTFSARQAEIHAEAGIAMARREVEVSTLARICEEHVDAPIDFLSIDVEGHELEVLQGGDWERWRPRVVVVEATEPGVTTPTHARWEHVLVGAGYSLAIFDGLNRFYVRDEDKDLASALSTPVNIFDDYVPYEYSRRINELQSETAALSRSHAASRAANDSLRSALNIFTEQHRVLRLQQTNLEKAVASLQAQCEEARAMIADTHSRYAQLRRDTIEARIEAASAQSMFETVGEEGLILARQMGRVSRRFPKAGSLAKRVISKAVAVKRRRDQ